MLYGRRDSRYRTYYTMLYGRRDSRYRSYHYNNIIIIICCMEGERVDIELITTITLL